MSVLVNSFILAAAGGDNPDAVAYWTAAGITNPTRRGLLNTFFNATTSIRPKLDRLFLMANLTSTAARTDLIYPTTSSLIQDEPGAYYYDSDGDGSPDTLDYLYPTFTTDRGIANGYDSASGATSSLKITGVNFATAKFNNAGGASVGIYWRTVPTTNSARLMTAGHGGSGSTEMNAGTNGLAARINTSGSQSTNSPYTKGLNTIRYDLGTNTFRGATQGPPIGPQFFAMSAVSARNATSNTSGTVNFGTYAPEQITCWFMGENMTDAELTTLYNAIEAYMVAIGAQA